MRSRPPASCLPSRLATPSDRRVTRRSASRAGRFLAGLATAVAVATVAASAAPFARSAEPGVALAAESSVSTSSGRAVWAVTVTAGTSELTITGVSAGLLGPDGTPVTAEVETKVPLKVTGGTSQVVSLRATLPRLGDYHGATRVTVTAGSTEERILELRLRVTRTASTATLTVKPDRIASVLVYAGEPATVRFALRETSGQAATADAPSAASVVRLVRRVGKDADVQVDLTGTTVSPALGSVTAGDATASPLSFDPHQTRIYKLVTAPLCHAGKYEGTLRSTAPGIGAADETFVIYVRDRWWLCAGAIGVGCALVMLLQWLSGRLRPHLARRRAVAELVARIESDAASSIEQPAVRMLVDDLRRQADDLARDAAQLDATAWADGLGVMRSKGDAFPAWLAGYLADASSPGNANLAAAVLACAKALFGRRVTAQAVDNAAAAVRALTPPPPDLKIAPPPKVVGPTVARLRWLGLVVDVAIHAGVAAATIALGLTVHWVDSLTWGSIGDYLTAFLWGLGLQGSATAGLAGVRTRLLG